MANAINIVRHFLVDDFRCNSALVLRLGMALDIIEIRGDQALCVLEGEDFDIYGHPSMHGYMIPLSMIREVEYETREVRNVILASRF